jgi:hypothetical protein
MKLKTVQILFLWLGAFLASGLAHAQVQAQTQAQTQTELELYRVPLRTATVAEFIAAATKSGVSGPIPETANASTLEFDASRVGVPALGPFKLLRQGQDIVSVQFTVSLELRANEALRKMLVAKYGAPVITERIFGRGGSFDDAHFFATRAHWTFAGGMKLVYSSPHMGGTHLTYVNEPRFKALMAASQAQADQSAREKANTLGDKF